MEVLPSYAAWWRRNNETYVVALGGAWRASSIEGVNELFDTPTHTSHTPVTALTQYASDVGVLRLRYACGGGQGARNAASIRPAHSKGCRGVHPQ